MSEVSKVNIPLPKVKKWVLLITLMMFGFIMPYTTLARMTFLPVVMAEFNAMHMYALVSITGLLSIALANPIAGKLGDMYGRKAVLLWGVILFASSCVICGMATNAYIFILGILIFGIGYGSAVATIKTLIADICETAEQPKVQGLTGMIENAAQLIGPVLGGLFADYLNWRWAYLVCVPLTLIGLFIAYRSLPRRDKTKHAAYKVDIAGTIAFIVALPPLLIMISMGGSSIAWVSVESLILICVSAIGFISLILIERKVKEPMIALYMFKDAVFRRIFMTSILAVIASTSVQYYAVYIQNVCGLSSSVSGVLQLPRGVVTVFVVLIVGFIISKTRNYKLIFIAESAMMLIASLMFVFFTPQSNMILFTISSILNGLGFGGIVVCALTFAQEITPKHSLGAASSLIIFTSSFGSSIGSAVAGMFVNGAWSKAPSLIDDSLKSVLTPDQLALLSDQATLQSSSVIESISQTLPAELVGTLDNTINALRMQLMSGLSRFSIFCVCAAAIAILYALLLPKTAVKRAKEE